MIGRLEGRLLEKHPPWLLIDVAGVGYEVQVSMTTCFQLPEVKASVSLYIHHSVRDDGHYLYGFAKRQERSLFRTLLKVNGVGPKLALTILSSATVEEFVRCVHEQDTAGLIRLPGVGKKTAQRLMVEMRDRLADWEPTLASNTPVSTGSLVTGRLQEATVALVSLGYSPQQASKALNGLAEDPQRSVEDLIRLALKGIAA